MEGRSKNDIGTRVKKGIEREGEKGDRDERRRERP